MASRFWCGSRTKATPSVMASSVQCRLGREADLLGVRRRERPEVGMPSAARARSKRWARSVSSSCSARARASRTPAEAPAICAALETGVVLDAEAGDGRDLAAPQSRHAAGADRREADLLRGDAGAASSEELADLCSVVHVVEGMSIAHRRPSGQGCPASAPINRDSRPATRRVDSMSRCHLARNVRESPANPSNEVEHPPCVELSCTPPVTCESRSAKTRGSSSRPTPSSACPRPASAGPTSGPTGASSRSTTR